MRNRRKNPRIRARGLAVHVSANGRRHPCVVENISIGGLFIRTDSLLDIGTELRVDLVRPGWKRALQLGARVVSRTDPATAQASGALPGMGAQFFGMASEQRDRLEQLLDELGIPPAGSGEPAEKAAPALDFDLDAIRVPAAPARRPQPEPIELDPLDPQPPMKPQAVDSLDPDLPAIHPISEIVPAAPPPPPPPSDAARLMLQIQGLFLELSEAHDQLRQKDNELARLRDEVAALKGAVSR